MMAPGLVSSTILFPPKKLCLWNENLNTSHRCLLKVPLRILFKFDISFFSCCSLTRLVNVAWFCTCPCIFHNIYVSAFWSPPVTQPATLSQIQEWNTKNRCGICSKLMIKTSELHQCFLMFSCQWGRFDIFVNFTEQISHLLLEVILLVLNRYIPAKYILTFAFFFFFFCIYFVSIFTLEKILILYFNPLIPGGKKRSFIVKQICI